MRTTTKATNDMIASLRERGIEVIDQRGMLPVNPNPQHRYGLLPGGLMGVQYAIVHWTGDKFSPQFFASLGLPDVENDGKIDETWTVQHETVLARWYADLHIKNDGGVWGGIAYGALVFPSGRVHVCWDIGALTYHAFNANSRSYAVSCPLSNWAEPTKAQYIALTEVLDWLCSELPESRLTPGRVYGHQQVGFLDARNSSTACPGTLIPFVNAYRNGESLSPWIGVELPENLDAMADRQLDEAAAARGYGPSLGAGHFDKVYNGQRIKGKASVYRPQFGGLAALVWMGPNAVMDISPFALDDLVTYWVESGVLIKNGNW